MARAVDLSAEKYCSVAIMLGKGVEITHSYEVLELNPAGSAALRSRSQFLPAKLAH